MARTTNQTFLYTDRLRWEPLIVKNSEGRAWMKTLSKDEKTGARTALIKYDPGFVQKKTPAQWPADTYVIEGEMTCGKKTYQAGTYHYRPGGSELGPISSPKGITRLVMTADSKTVSSKKEVFIQDVNTMPWGPTYSHYNDPNGNLKGGTRLLREDPVQKITVIIHAFWVPERSQPGEGHRHDHIEEAFTLEGEMEDFCEDVEGHVHWVPGTYICRRPNAGLHGDTNKWKVPVVNFIRRGWVGDTAIFHQRKNMANTKGPVSVMRTFDE